MITILKITESCLSFW